MIWQKELHLKISSVNLTYNTKLKELRKIRVGLYQPYTASMDEGWTRLLLENYAFDFKSIVNKDFKNKKMKDSFDVIIIPDMNGDQIKTAKPKRRERAFLQNKTAGI